MIKKILVEITCEVPDDQNDAITLNWFDFLRHDLEKCSMGVIVNYIAEFSINKVLVKDIQQA